MNLGIVYDLSCCCFQESFSNESLIASAQSRPLFKAWVAVGAVNEFQSWVYPPGSTVPDDSRGFPGGAAGPGRALPPPPICQERALQARERRPRNSRLELAIPKAAMRHPRLRWLPP